MSIITENNIMSFKEFLFTEATYTQGGENSRKVEDEWTQGKKGTQSMADDMYNNYVDHHTNLFKINRKNFSMYKDTFQKIVSTLATKYKFYIDNVKMAFVALPKVIHAIEHDKPITVTMH